MHDPSDGSWREWPLPGDDPMTYAVYVDENDIVWLTDFGANAIVRFDPATEQFESIPLELPEAAVRQLAGRPGRGLGRRVRGRQADRRHRRLGRRAPRQSPIEMTVSPPNASASPTWYVSAILFQASKPGWLSCSWWPSPVAKTAMIRNWVAPATGRELMSSREIDARTSEPRARAGPARPAPRASGTHRGTRRPGPCRRSGPRQSSPWLASWCGADRRPGSRRS